MNLHSNYGQVPFIPYFEELPMDWELKQQQAEATKWINNVFGHGKFKAHQERVSKRNKPK